MSLLYDGQLTSRVAEQIDIANREYGYAVELSAYPKDFYEWQQTHLLDYDDTGEDCMGQTYRRKTKKYMVVQKNWQRPEEGLFLFFVSKQEKDAVIAAFPQFVVKAEPFKTLIGEP